ncbi:MAG: hypothetical protein IJ845_09930 [Bacteroidaceae bacterium]|nr:hypothetical protein [Bacteroidaceae bacterium]
MKTINFSKFIGFRGKVAEDITLLEVNELITTSPDLKQVTERHRALLAKGWNEEAKKYKNRMMTVTVGTHCSGGRTKACIDYYTGYSLADFDHLTPEKLENCLELLPYDPYWVLAYTSIGGAGLHVVYRIPLVEDEEHYKKAFYQGNIHYAKLFGADYDAQDCDPTRVMGLCHDPKCLFRQQAEVFPVDFSLRNPRRTLVRKMHGSRQTEKGCDLRRAVRSALRWVKSKGFEYVEGHRNEFAMQTIYKLNRIGAAQEEVQEWAVERFADLGQSEVEAIVRSCYQHTDEHGKEPMMKRRGSHQKKDKTIYATPTQIAEFLQTQAQFRKNTVTRYTEMLPLGQTEWQRVTDYEVHSLWLKMDGQTELPRPHGAKEFFQILDSSFVPLYNPFEDYFQSLPEWHEGDTDYIGQLAATVHTTADEHFAHCLRKWLVAMVAAFFSPTVVNQTIMVFIGEQGIYKTKWFNSLLPPELRLYFCTRSHTDQYSKDDRLMLAEFALICFEEIDSPGRTALAQLKAMVTMEKVNERAAYARNKEERLHIASFCATGNNKQFLVDPTGNRRWLAFEVLEIADPYRHAIDYRHLYAQVYALWKQGFQYYFTQEEIRRLNERNEEFMNVTPEEEMLLTHFSRPTRQQPGRYLTSTQIISHCNPWVKQPLRQRVMVEALKKHGYQMQRRGSLRCYYIVPLDSAQVAEGTKEQLRIEN